MNGLPQHQHAELLQFVGDLVGGGGLGQQDDARVGLGHGIGAQLVAELIRQRRVDDDDLKVLRRSIWRRASPPLAAIAGRV